MEKKKLNTPKRKIKIIVQIFIIIDDFADDPSFTRRSQHLHSLYARGRHDMISTITPTQEFNALCSIIRLIATELMYIVKEYDRSRNLY